MRAHTYILQGIEYSGYLRNYTADQLIKPIEALGFKCRAYAHNEIAVKVGLKRHGTIMCALGETNMRN